MDDMHKESVEARQKIETAVAASSALEGFESLTPDDGLPYRLQQDWIQGKISIEDRIDQLKKHIGVA